MHPMLQSPATSWMPRRRGMATSLRIEPPAQIQQIALALGSDGSDSDYPSPQKNKPRRNMKKLSLLLPSAQSSFASLQSPLDSVAAISPRPSLPTINPNTSILLRKDEDGGSPSVPYIDGPVQIIPGIWIGSEDNACDWKGLVDRGIRSILNVAKEITSPFDSQPFRHAISTCNNRSSDPTYYPPLPTGRPAMYYLQLQWSHGQQNLVNDGFQAGMAFADAARNRGDGCLIHCQCGISRSATMIIAIVMRAAAERAVWVPPEVWALKGMQEAYSFVKEKSPCVGPNMSLIYQLMEYEKKLKGDMGYPADSDGSSGTDEEEEWGRRRKMLDKAFDNDQRESNLDMQEAHALDKAMEDRIVARKSSASSMSSMGSGISVGATGRSRYTHKRTESIASTRTNRSFLSEHLVEENEEQELLGVGGESDRDARLTQASTTTSPDETEETESASQFASIPPRLPTCPPPAPDWKVSVTPPMSAMRSTFQLPARPPRQRKRPMSLNILPPVPSFPKLPVADELATARPTSHATMSSTRQRAGFRCPVPPPHLRDSVLRRASVGVVESTSAASTPSQTLFVFPPSPTFTTRTRTPSTMTLTSGAVPFPNLSTPRVSTFKSKGRTRSFISFGAPPTPTVAFSKVDARGYVGLG